MASNYTANYKLCQWQASDKVLRTEFNEDNAKIDAAIKTVDNRVTSLSGSKADQSALSTLQTLVTAQGDALDLRNCQFVTGSYMGDGTVGQNNPVTLSFPYKPVFLCVAAPSYFGHFYAFRGQFSVWHTIGTDLTRQALTWEDRSVSWYNIPSLTAISAKNQLNYEGITYPYFALLELE